MSNPARFLSRWARLKQQAAVETPAVPAVLSDVDAALPLPAADAPSVAGISGADLTALLREELSEAVRKQTLKAIFADPHFNVMDGLDTYIDDYSISEPIPPEMLASLNQARFLFETKEENPVDEHAAEAPVGIDCDNLDHAGQEVAPNALTEIQEKEK